MQGQFVAFISTYERQMKFDVGVVGEYEEDRNCCAVLLEHAPQLFEYEALVLTLRALLELDFQM
jgi:hypothetical protein